MAFLDRATPLLAKGFSIIPLIPKGKQPVPGLGVTHRTRDTEIIGWWASSYPDANVAVCADDNTIILDTDDAYEMVKQTGDLDTYTVASSPGKCHYYFKRPAFPVKNLELGGLGSLRAQNHYVVGAGSIHPKTGEAYVVTRDAPVAEMPADLYRKLEELAANAERDLEKVTLGWDGKSKFKEGWRQYFLRHRAGQLWDGVRTEEEILATLIEENNIYCDPPKEMHELTRLAAWAVTKEPNLKAAVPVLGGAPRPRTGHVMDGIEKFDEWFPVGQLSLIFGDGGAGKSTFALQMLEQVVIGGVFLGHNCPRSSVRLILIDRDEESLGRTLERMGMPRDRFNYTFLGREARFDLPSAVMEIRKALEKDPPDVLLVEGLDVLCAEENKKSIKPVLTTFQDLAKHYGIAVIATWGAPKRQASRDAYKGVRSAAAGSAIISRLCSTMVYVREDFETGMRLIECTHRDAANEKFDMKFEDGRLALVAATDIPDADPKDFVEMSFRKGWGYKKYAEMAGEGAVSRATWHRRRDEA